MAISTDQIRERYQAMTDEQLMKIANYEAADLNENGLAMLREEIQIRKLNPTLESAIQSQVHGIDEAELPALYEKVITCPCPQCGEDGELLESAIATEIASVLFFSNKREAFLIACPNCLAEMVNKAYKKTLLLGWWGIPSGIINTTVAVIKHHQSEEKKDLQSQLGLSAFVFHHAAFLKANHENTEAIFGLLKQNNATELGKSGRGGVE